VFVHGQRLEDTETWRFDHTYADADLAAIIAAAGLSTVRLPLDAVRADAATMNTVLSDAVGNAARLAKPTVVIADAEGATGIRYFRSDSSAGPFTLVATLPANPGLGARFGDTTRVAGQTTFYEVQPFNVFGDGPISRPVEAFTTATTSGVVRNTRVTAVGGGGLRVNWDPVPVASRYEVEVFRQSDGEFVADQVVEQTDATVWLDVNVGYNVTVFPIP